MNMKKIRNLILLALFAMCFTATTAYARVLLEDFTYENRELLPCPSAVGIADPQVKNGALCFDYSDVPQDGNTYGNYVYQPWVNAEKTLYVDFTFDRNVVENTTITVALRNYDINPGEISVIKLEDSTLTLGNTTVSYGEKTGRFTFSAEDTETGCFIILYVNGVPRHSYTATGFFLKASPNSFETRFQTAATQNAGDVPPVISFDNIKIMQDEPIPQELYVTDAQLHYDFENSGKFFMSESVFPFYKVKSVRQIANFSNQEQTCDNILVQRGGGDKFSLESVTLQPGEVALAELSDDPAHQDYVHTVESYVWDIAGGVLPLTEKSISAETPARADRPEVLESRLEQLGDTHPRLLTTAGNLSNNTEYRFSDPTYKAMYDALVNWEVTYDAGDYLSDPIPRHGSRPGEVCDMIYHRATVWGFLYQTTRNEQYAADLTRDMLAIAEYQNWYDPVNYQGGLFLHTSHIARSMAIGYDMIYDYLCKPENATKKATIESAIYEKAIRPYLDFQREDTKDGWQRRTENFNMICNSGIGTAALAIGNIEEYSRDCAIALNYALRSLRYSAGYFGEGGGWTEGPNYYSYMMTHGNDFIASLINTFGDDYGYRDFSGMNDSAYDPITLSGSKYAYAYSDTPADVLNNSVTMAYFAKYANKPELGFYRRNRFTNVLDQVKAGALPESALNGTYSVLDLLWYVPSFKNQPEHAGDTGYDDTYGIPLDVWCRDTGMVALHTDYSDTQGFVAANYGDNNDWHNHTDMGGFVYEAQGEQWFVELGFVEYDFPCGGNTYDDRLYRNKPEGHNCMIFNPVQDDCDQIISAKGTLVEDPVFGEDESYFVMDLTNGYADRLNSYTRTISLDKNTQGIKVKDSFSLKGNNNEYYWFAHTKADIEIDEYAPQTAILTQNGKKLMVTVEGGEFTYMAAERLKPFSAGSGLTAEPANSGVNKLVVHATGMSGDCEIIVTAVPLDAAGGGSLPNVPLQGTNDIHGLSTVTFGGADEAAAGWWGYFADLGEGFYWGSNPNNGGSEGLRAYIASGGKDGANDYYAKLEKDDSKGYSDGSAMQLGYRYNQYATNLWNDGVVYVEYDLRLPSYTEATWGSGWGIRFGMNMGGVNNALAMWGTDIGDHYKSIFSFEGACTDTGYQAIKMGEWTHHKWVLDYTNHTMQLWQDGVAVLNNSGSAVLSMNPAHDMYNGFSGLTFEWAGQKGDVGVDNLKVTYKLAVPYIKSVDFGTDNEKGGKVLTTATTASLEIPGMVYSTDGKTMADYVSLVDSNGNVVAGSSAAMAADGKTVNVTFPALTSGETYQLKFSKNTPYGREGHSMHQNASADTWVVKSTQDDSIYTFIVVDTLK